MRMAKCFLTITMAQIKNIIPIWTKANEMNKVSSKRERIQYVIDGPKFVTFFCRESFALSINHLLFTLSDFLLLCVTFICRESFVVAVIHFLLPLVVFLVTVSDFLLPSFTFFCREAFALLMNSLLQWIPCSCRHALSFSVSHLLFQWIVCCCSELLAVAVSDFILLCVIFCCRHSLLFCRESFGLWMNRLLFS